MSQKLTERPTTRATVTDVTDVSDSWGYIRTI